MDAYVCSPIRAVTTLGVAIGRNAARLRWKTQSVYAIMFHKKLVTVMTDES